MINDYTSERENVYMPARAYNLYGLPSQKFMEEHGYTVETYKNAVNKIIEEDWKIRDINLSNADLIRVLWIKSRLCCVLVVISNAQNIVIISQVSDKFVCAEPSWYKQLIETMNCIVESV